MDFEKVKEIIVETLSCDADKVTPDAAPFVQVGDHVKKGQTVCLMEAMKMMNEVQAPCDCVIEEILQEDGALVSFGEPLLRYREG